MGMPRKTAAGADEAARRGSVERCAVQCLLKPFSESALIEALNAALLA